MLFAIDWLGAVPMSQLAAFLRVSMSAATGLLDRLVEQGLAQRETDPRDRRIVRAAATEPGLALALELRSAGTDRLVEFWSISAPTSWSDAPPRLS